MKAYMSTGTAHAEDGSRYTPGFNVETAEREARAILAETEPQGCGSYQALTWLGDWSPDMADALRAFIES